MCDNLHERLIELLGGERNFIANASNFSSMIFSCMKDLNWVGFYLLSGDELILGPFQGKPACYRIPYGKGVCGTSAKTKQTIVVDNVNAFPGHIACDPISNSEMVIPLIYNKVLYGVLDIDSPSHSRFREADVKEMEDLVQNLLTNSDMTALSRYYSI